MSASALKPKQLVADYKRILRSYIDQRPSGMRQKMARALGTHKSFISQITNPNDPTPIPMRHLETITDVCHLAAHEKARFLEAYHKAHPGHVPAEIPCDMRYKTLQVRIPVLENAYKQEALEQLIHETVQRFSALLSDEGR